MKNLKGSILIGKVSSNKEPYHYMHIQIRDEESGCIVVELEMSMEAFAKSITGGNSPCDIPFFNDSGNIGKIHEYKEEVVPLGFQYTEDEKTDAIAIFEVDGWKGRREDLGNMHRRIRTRTHDLQASRVEVIDGWRVTYDRYVERKKK